MAQKLEDWLKTIDPIVQFAKINTGKMVSEKFMRDPIRPIVIDPNYFYSPADGIILYSRFLSPKEKLAEIKGVNYSLQDMMEDQNFNQRCLVIGIFMTFYDVHINRMPYGGFLKYKVLPPTSSYNKPMCMAENDILGKKIGFLYKDMKYLKSNARMLSTIYSPQLDYTYHLIQIADDIVNVITPFSTQQNHWFSQNERFSFVRWGSQVELILPLDKRYDFEPLLPKLMHVEGCLDKLIRVVKK